MLHAASSNAVIAFLVDVPCNYMFRGGVVLGEGWEHALGECGFGLGVPQVFEYLMTDVEINTASFFM